MNRPTTQFSEGQDLLRTSCESQEGGGRGDPHLGKIELFPVYKEICHTKRLVKCLSPQVWEGPDLIFVKYYLFLIQKEKKNDSNQKTFLFVKLCRGPNSAY